MDALADIFQVHTVMWKTSESAKVYYTIMISHPEHKEKFHNAISRS